MIAVVFGIAALFGLDGIWFSVTIVQMILAVAAGALLRWRHHRRVTAANQVREASALGA